MALLVRARDAEGTQLCAAPKQNPADEDPPSRFALRRGNCADALRDKCYGLPRCFHSFYRNLHDPRERNVTNGCDWSRKLGPHAPAETDKREPNRDEPSAIHRAVRIGAAGAATVNMRVGRDPFGNWMRPFSFFATTSNAISSSLLGHVT